jgi:hypothetical protein
VKEQCEVLIIYEDAKRRAEAVRFCDALVEKFWSKNNFQIEWCPFADLQSKTSADRHAEIAATAHILIFALRPESGLAWDLHAWVESWLNLRGEREGVVIGLLDTTPTGESGGNYCFLRQAAHRGGLDYLTQIPDSILHCISDSLDSYSRRATEVTSVLDEILHQRGKAAAWVLES